MIMRLSAHLKGKDYRDLLEISDLTYSASCPDALFGPLFEQLARAIGCNSAIYIPIGKAPRPREKACGTIVFEASLSLAREYTDYYWALDPSCITRWTKEPNRVFRTTDLVPASSFIKSEFAIDFAARVPYCWGLGGILGTQGHLLGGIALQRLRHERDFSDRDVAFLGALLPHLSRVLLLFEDRTQRLCATGILILDDIGTVVYSNEAASHILRQSPAEAIPLPIDGVVRSHEKSIFQNELGDYAVGVQTIPGPYKVVSLEPVMHDSLRARLAFMGLTPRQQEIASQVLRGWSNKRIASELDLMEQTVKDHLHAIFRKLGIHHRAELASRVLPLSSD
jgi:DNA-binding CsgD family transcriptional regulator